MILRVASFTTKICAQSPEAFQGLLGRRALEPTMSVLAPRLRRLLPQGGNGRHGRARLRRARRGTRDARRLRRAAARRPDAARRRAAGAPNLDIPEGGARAEDAVGPGRAARRRGGIIARADGARYHARDIEQRRAAAASTTPSRRTTASPTRPSTSLVYTACWAPPLGRRGRPAPSTDVWWSSVEVRAVPVATGEFTLKRAGGAFFLDAIYVHEKAAPPVRDVQAVYDALLKLLAHRSSYVMETTRSQQKLQSYFLLLLAHPTLRDAQDAALAKLDPEAAQRTASPPPPPADEIIKPPPRDTAVDHVARRGAASAACLIPPPFAAFVRLRLPCGFVR